MTILRRMSFTQPVTARRGLTIMEATVALSIAAFTVAIATQLMVSSHRGQQLQTQREQALRELDNALEMAFWMDQSQLENTSLEKVARTIVETAQATGTAPDGLAIALTITDDPSMPQTKRIDAVASYREKGSDTTLTLPTISIWRSTSSVAEASIPEASESPTSGTQASNPFPEAAP